MKKVIPILLGGFLLTLPCFLFAQQPAQDDEAEVGTVHLEHFYLTLLEPEYDGAIDNIPMKLVIVNREGLFHTLEKPEAMPDINLQPWDSLYYATRHYLTFYFDKFVYKRADTIHVSDVSDNCYESVRSVGIIKGTFINGVKEGLWEKRVFAADHTSRKVIDESYKNGVLNGARTVYNMSGTQIHQTIFVNGTGSYNDYYYNSGRPAVSGFMVYGKRHGWWRYYNEERKMIREEFYKHGLLHGPLTVYDDSGNTIYESNFVNGTGEYRVYKNGALKESGRMVDGRRVGEWRQFNVSLSSSGLQQSYNRISYKVQDPINDPGNIIDVMFYDGDYITLRAGRDK